jgi:hypothetical protein
LYNFLKEKRLFFHQKLDLIAENIAHNIGPRSGQTTGADAANFVKKVSAKILEGFLRTIPDSGRVDFDLALLVECGSRIEADLRDGYFYPAPDIPPETEHLVSIL